MQTRVIPIGSNDGMETFARQMACDCGCDNFIVFQIVSQDHLHFQCIRCNTSFCSDPAACKELHDDIKATPSLSGRPV